MGESNANGGAEEAIDWTVLKSIQEANAASMDAMEEYLLIASGPAELGNPETTLALLERSIAHHEKVIDQLELAAEQLEGETRVRAD